MKPNLSSVVLLALVLTSAIAAEPPEILLRPDGVPGSEGKTAPEAVRVTNDGEYVVKSVHNPSPDLSRQIGNDRMCPSPRRRHRKTFDSSLHLTSLPENRYETWHQFLFVYFPFYNQEHRAIPAIQEMGL